ncbi:RHS repeat-associated protein [Archangium gephyra]|uniref:RHS repeat-associated protein n=1 Tax=Archangium gephyra TaxID=48 RepID=A0AAC8QBZ4_9BACT|nr:RHS repeat-associated core domain-containing protein [Archangium gephyra]AKJ04550.1 Rhs-family protein [Archangium gephyra]REG37381.1 RHS repeat-associated protein [Archangium gephyra]
MSGSAPSIRGFQLDATSVGDVRSNVNLFRGDVNLSQPLFTMPGRSDDQALDVSVTLLYQSNVTLQAWSWNRAQPTGVLGLGWSLPLERIELRSGLTPESRQYQVVTQGSGAELIAEPQAPGLFSLATSEASGLVDGAVVPAGLVSGFARFGTVLSATARASLQADGSWLLSDDDEQRLFRLRMGAEVTVLDGGQSFQLQNYAFWRIIYYAPYERWAITDDTGVVKSYGGLAPGSSSTGRSNSIAWSVVWSSGEGAPLWKGPSITTDGQQRSARAWYLESVRDLWGDAVRYAYNGVEQRVGSSTGLAYTKAVYLTTITDVFGRRACFSYGDKLWSNDDDRAREYADPHKDTPDDSPNAWQDAYETRYLSGISVVETDGTELFGVSFGYEPNPGGADPAVVNLTRATGRLAGDCAKRLLTSLQVRGADGVEQPATRLTYFTDASADGYAPGALASLTTPGGAVARYSYTAQELDVCQRDVIVSSPDTSNGQATGTPRIWYGSDYAVVVWYSSSPTRLSVQLHTWQGRWIASGDPQTLTTDAILLDTLQVCCGRDFFSLSVERASNSCSLYLFSRDPARPWSFAPVQPDGSLGEDGGTPVVLTTVAAGADKIVHLAGQDFVLMGCQSGSSAAKLDRYTWSFSERRWNHTSHANLPNQAFWLTCGASHYFLLEADGTATLSWVDATGTWTTSASTSRPAWWPSSVNLSTPIALTAGESMVAVAYLTSQGSTSPRIALSLYQWDARHQLGVYTYPTYLSGTLPISGVSPALGVPVVVEDTVVALGPWVLRFDGSTWALNSSLYSPQSGGMARYSHSASLSLGVTLSSSGALPVVKALAYDGSDWAQLDSLTPKTPLPKASGPAGPVQSWPNAGSGDWATVGCYLYFRGNSPSWADALAGTPEDLQALVNASLDNNSQSTRYAVDTLTLVNQGPMFLAFNVEDTLNASAENAWTLGLAPLGNGAILHGSPIELTKDRLSDGGPGQSAAGQATLCTFPAGTKDFSHATSLTLRRYAGDSLTADPSTPTAQLSGNIRHYAVSAFSVDDGLSQRTTRIVPDASSAACDSSGTVAKYYATSVFPGSGSPASTPFGSVRSTYINGIGGETAGSDVMLDGLLSSVELQDASGAPLSTLSMTWDVYRQRAASPQAPGADVLDLYGGFVVRTSLSRDTDGVRVTRSTGYVQDGFQAPWSSRAVSNTSAQIGSTGTRETSTSLTTGAATVSPLHAALHMLSAQAGRRTTWRSDDQPAVTTTASASLAVGRPNRRGVTVPAQSGSYAWNGTCDPTFPWSDPSDLSGWTSLGQVSGWDTYGLITEQVDAGNVPGSLRRSSQLSLPIAGCNGARLSDWRAHTFEPDDPGEGFTTQGGSGSSDCWMGTRSLSLAARGSLAVSLGASAGTLVWSGWIRAARDASFQLTATADGVTLPTQTLTGQGDWTHVLVPVTLTSRAQTLTLTLLNGSGAAILVDMVAVCPKGAALQLQTVDPVARQVTAQSSLGGSTTRYHYSAAGVRVGQSGAGEQLQEWTVNGLSRQATADDDFTSSHPNASWSLQPAGGGRVEGFRQGDDWAGRWVPSTGSTWSRADGALTLQGSLEAAVSSTSVEEGFAVVVEVAREEGSGWMGFHLGALSLGWDNGWSWPGGPEALCTPSRPGALWMLVVADGQLLLVVDGLLIFSGAFDASGLTSIRFDTGSGTARLRNLGLLRAPRLRVDWQDGTTQERQNQYRWGSDARVSQVVRDALGRTVAATRMAPGSCRPDTALAPMVFRPDFVDESAFLDTLDSTWAMTGALVDYYADEDGAFPYSGTRYEPSARKRKLEQGAPSEALAITQVDSTSVTDRATTSFRYGSTLVGEGSVRQHTTRNPVGRQSQRALSGPQSALAAETFDASSVSTGRASQVTSYASASDGGVSTRLLQTPNGGGKGVPSVDEPYVSRSILNPLGQQLRLSDPDTGTTRFWYTAEGQVRFAAPALDAGEQGLVYQRYDARGRLVELGTLDTSVDDQTLSNRVNDMSWPDSGVAHTVIRRWDWDGDGQRPNELGNLIRVTTTLPAPQGFSSAATVTESFTHDAGGHVMSANLDVSADTSFSASISYGYNAQGEVVELRFPEGSPISAVHYGYNDQGQVETIGTSPGADDIARYTYTPDGAVRTEYRGAGRLRGTLAWTGSGWPLGQRLTVDGATVWSQALQRAADGSVSDFLETWAGESEVQWTCTYDGNGRLTRCQPSQGAGDEQITSYDANGNILGARLDGTSLSATLAGASNRLDSVSLGGGDSRVTTTAAGYVSAWGDFSAVTERSLGLPVRAARGGTVLRLAYGGQGQRVLRQVAGGSTRFVHCGAGSVPLLWSTGGAVSVAVWGPTGLVMVADASGRYFPVCDSQHTVHGLLDASGKRVARWDWSAFGGLVSSEGDTGRLFLGYQGQEWDADLRVHNFVARLYDPSLRRFLAPDPARQYSSPYVFVGGDPLRNVDSTGQVSGATIALGATSAAIAAVSVAGAALTVFTFGASDAVAASVDASLVAAEAAEAGAAVAVDAAEVAVDAGVEAGTGLAVEGTADATGTAAEGGAEAAAAGSEGASELSAGAEAGAEQGARAVSTSASASTSASTSENALKKLGSEMLKSGLKGTMRSAIRYNVQGVVNDDWSVKGLLGAMGKGFLGSMVGGFLSGTMELGLTRSIPGARAYGKLGKACISLTASTVSGMACGDMGQVLSNARNGDPLYSQLGRSTVLGAVNGAVSYGACEAITRTIGAPAGYTVAVSATMLTTLGALGISSDDASTAMSGGAR